MDGMVPGHWLRYNGARCYGRTSNANNSTAGSFVANSVRSTSSAVTHVINWPRRSERFSDVSLSRTDQFAACRPGPITHTSTTVTSRLSGRSSLPMRYAGTEKARAEGRENPKDLANWEIGRRLGCARCLGQRTREVRWFMAPACGRLPPSRF